MSLPRRINRVLAATLGIRIVRAGRRKPVPVAAPPPPKPQPAPAPKPASREEKYPADYDEMAVPILRAAHPYSMTRMEKRYALYLATRYVVEHDIPGAIVECGVWRGGSMHVVARTLLAIGNTERDLYLFDTFEGMTEPTEKDLTYSGKPVAELMSEQPRTARIWAVASLEDVRQGFEAIPYPQERIHFVQGPVESTLPGRAPERIAILRLDTDWYESTRHELLSLYDRLVPGGVLIIDDYGTFQGARQAVDEFVKETGARLLLSPLGPGRIAVKPFAPAETAGPEAEGRMP
ncbi:TylF/MycF/NovP-related O-methyltransferase [Actinoplanes sp. DH11]|uniref:TylF/MycF/NovP-related O-methyltransferase n=1 Tax=Actinoplanes sp. DH11 TaxID=2857011 RepID=UPI001E3CB8A6|nr:TylF/MycF/NovP-related O-methyltransferase [Actinoplanes sp. DH11]